MKLALIADIHGNSIALDRVLVDARNQSVQEFVILGDVIMMGSDPSLVLQTLHDLNPACWIKGNTDMWVEEITDGWQPGTPREEIAYSYYNFAKERLGAEDIRFISNLPTEKTFSYIGVTILCVHGSPGSVNKGMDDRVSPEQLELMVQGVKEGIIVSGHTHVPYLGKVNDKWIFNFGSVGRSFDGNNLASYGIIDFTSGTPVFEIRRVFYPVEETVRMATEKCFPFIDTYAKSLVEASIS